MEVDRDEGKRRNTRRVPERHAASKDGAGNDLSADGGSEQRGRVDSLKGKTFYMVYTCLFVYAYVIVHQNSTPQIRLVRKYYHYDRMRPKNSPIASETKITAR